MNPKQIAKDTAKVLQSYLTYQAVRTIVDQLSETNPTQAIWLSQYSAGKMQDGEIYLEGLMLEHKDLVLRILTVRETIAEAVLEFLPEMVQIGIQQSNAEYRRQVLERLTRSQPLTEIPSLESMTELEGGSPPRQDEPSSTD
ncbi:chaperonin family protein RbcX [Spirulina subsalsa FACHB-351]|uniref:RuBisCO chaperone RbcX n=1 Tax=Spirulina subsalsa FACHB-351 TaxID=234711 RepID=A0ABT3L252_9CYAN|nr:chaperonin family protein RbcX [Spirulina subsalsa]MCW6035199.1 chaperonin family protein RbcX [Spirulina subsalsa FACHB-351]